MAILLQNGRTSEALIASKKSVSLAPKDAEAKYNLGLIQHKLGKFDDAINKYSMAISTDPFTFNLTIWALQQELGRLEDVP